MVSGSSLLLSWSPFNPPAAARRAAAGEGCRASSWSATPRFFRSVSTASQNLTWLDATDVFRVHPPPAGGRRKVQAEFYRSHVGSGLVLPTIRAAREFLINDPQLGPL